MPETTPRQRLSSLGFSGDVADALWPGDGKTAQDLSLDDASSPVLILRALSGAMGAEWVTWEPETLWAEFKRHLGKAPSEILKGKVQALKTLLVADAFWKDHLAFEKVVVALNGRVPNFDLYQHPSPAMIARALRLASGIRAAEFSDEVLRYVAAICYEDGLVVLPEPLDVAQESLDEMTSRVVGRQLPEEIRRAWKLNDVKQGLYTETVTGVQLAKMAAIREYASANH